MKKTSSKNGNKEEKTTPPLEENVDDGNKESNDNDGRSD